MVWSSFYKFTVLGTLAEDIIENIVGALIVKDNTMDSFNDGTNLLMNFLHPVSLNMSLHINVNDNL